MDQLSDKKLLRQSRRLERYISLHRIRRHKDSAITGSKLTGYLIYLKKKPKLTKGMYRKWFLDKESA